MFVQVFLNLGWEHGDRGYFDNPHVQKVFGLTPEKCLEKKEGKNLAMFSEIAFEILHIGITFSF